MFLISYNNFFGRTKLRYLIPMYIFQHSLSLQNPTIHNLKALIHSYILLNKKVEHHLCTERQVFMTYLLDNLSVQTLHCKVSGFRNSVAKQYAVGIKTHLCATIVRKCIKIKLKFQDQRNTYVMILNQIDFFSQCGRKNSSDREKLL